jgi:hypothetical protein
MGWSRRPSALSIEKIMNLRTVSPRPSCLIFSLGFCPLHVSAQTPAATQEFRDGQHDFDFRFGAWRTHLRILPQPLTASSTWIESDATVTVRQIWNGRALRRA